ncbi:Uncharacterised protein [Rothia kristinae]|nr:Uncharacterised protein [Rothia kristinae]
MAMVCGVMIAAPKPWKTRARIREAMDPENPHHREARVNTVSPVRYSLLGPKRSPSRPVISSGTA